MLKAAVIGAWAKDGEQSSGEQSSMDVNGSVQGDGSFGCIFTSPLKGSYDYGYTGLTLTCWAKFLPNTKGHFCTFGGDNTGFSIGHGARGDNGKNGNNINALANVRWWLPSDYTVSDGLWHHYVLVSYRLRGSSEGHGSHVFVDGIRKLVSEFGSSDTNATLSLDNSNITLLGVYDGEHSRFLTGNVTRFCIYDSSKPFSFIQDDFSLGNKAPSLDGLIHYYNGASADGKLIDQIGGCDMTSMNGALLSNDIP